MKVISFAALIILFTAMTSWLCNLPQDIGLDVPDGKLNSLSFAPFREGQGPVQEVFPSDEQVLADLKLMGDKTHNIRTYASSEGNMPKVAEWAGKYGLTMLQGAWLNALPDKNEKEIAALIKSANEHPDVVKRVIVGNEVLLRGDLPADKLIGYIRRVKQAVKQPVSYADVWSMYLKYPELIKEVDFITIHILPYWEDRPISIEEAPDHIGKVVDNVRREANTIAPNKAILIGEAGWPSNGRQRGHALPSVVNEAKFIRSLLKVAKDNHFDVNIVEAFNQPWKSAFEGVVGASWGLYDSSRQQVFPLTGEVYENVQWFKHLTTSCVIFLILSLRYFKALQTLPTVRLVAFLALLQLFSVLLVNQTAELWYTSYNTAQRVQTAVIVLASIVLGGLLLKRSYALLSEQQHSEKLSKSLFNFYLLFSFYALYQTYYLATDGRYLSFPSTVTSIAVFGLIGLSMVRLMTQSQWTVQDFSLNQLLGNTASNLQNKLLGMLLLLLGIGLVIGETQAFMASRDLIMEQPDATLRLQVSLGFTLGNGQLVKWLVSLIILAIPMLISSKVQENINPVQ